MTETTDCNSNNSFYVIFIVLGICFLVFIYAVIYGYVYSPTTIEYKTGYNDYPNRTIVDNIMLTHSYSWLQSNLGMRGPTGFPFIDNDNDKAVRYMYGWYDAENKQHEKDIKMIRNQTVEMINRRSSDG